MAKRARSALQRFSAGVRVGAEYLRLTEHLSIGVELGVNLSARVVHDLSVFGVAQVGE
mgnify:CR=1 FL=1